MVLLLLSVFLLNFSLTVLGMEKDSPPGIRMEIGDPREMIALEMMPLLSESLESDHAKARVAGLEDCLRNGWRKPICIPCYMAAGAVPTTLGIFCIVRHCC